MTSIIIFIFVIGYLSITLEHPLKLDKTVPALIMASLVWAVLAIGFTNGWFDVINTEEQAFNFLSGNAAMEGFEGTLLHHLGKTAEILIFLIGAMTKTITHFAPYMGMMLALGVVWLVSEYIHPKEDFIKERRHLYSAPKALSRIEISSILFFLGILMSVAGLEGLVYGVVNGEEVGTLRYVAEVLHNAIPNQDIVILLLGVLSAVIDNVSLMAASMGMYEMPMDSVLWHFIAYSAGTGGSMLIIGSAANRLYMVSKEDHLARLYWFYSWCRGLSFIRKSNISSCLTISVI